MSAPFDQAENLVATQLPGELDSVLNAIRADAPNARIVVLGYPEFYDLSRSAGCVGLSTTDRTDLNQGADQLDGAIQAAAARHGDVFVDVRGAFAGHEICDSEQLAALGGLAEPGRFLPSDRRGPVRRLLPGLRRRGRLTRAGRRRGGDRGRGSRSPPLAWGRTALAGGGP